MTTRSRSLNRLLFVGLLFFIPGLVLAGPNEGGTLILHANPGLVFTSDIQNYCGMAALDSCSRAVTSVPWDPGRRIVFHAIAAFPAGSSPRLKVLSFGIDYDPTKFVMAARGTCADFEIPGVGWLAPGTGTSQSWTTGTRTALLTEAYWFAGYAYSEQDGEDSTSVALIPHPRQHGVFVDDAFPSEVDTIAGYGKLGFGVAGNAPCPEPLGEGDVPPSSEPGDDFPVPASDGPRGPVWAYGTEVPGDPWFEDRDGISYYHGVYQFFPRKRQPPPTIPPLPAADLAAKQVLDEAWAAARKVTTRSEWLRLYTQVLDTHRDVVESYTRGSRGVVIEFADVPFPYSISCPIDSPQSGRRAANPDSIRREEIDEFWHYYKEGCWIIWGVDYFMLVPPARQPKTTVAINRLMAFKASNLTGAALARAVATIDIRDTALQDHDFVRDLMTPQEGR
jgi:hypothetical protein